jgi:uncharacterized membrane protein
MQRREKSFKSVTFFLFLIFTIWFLLQILAPLFSPTGSIDNLSGMAVLSDNEDKLSELNFPWNFVYSAGDRLCHQKMERSLFINGNQMPFCTRCTAIWLGITIGLGIMIFYKIKLDNRFLILILLGIVPIGIDGTGQLLGLWESQNILRLATGLIIGSICGISISIIIDEIREISSNRLKRANNL